MTHTSTELPEALRLAEMLMSGSAMIPEIDLPEAAAELLRLHAREQELKAIRKAACKAYNAWAYADDTFGEVTQAMHALADAINGITQEKQG